MSQNIVGRAITHARKFKCGRAVNYLGLMFGMEHKIVIFRGQAMTLRDVACMADDIDSDLVWIRVWCGPSTHRGNYEISVFDLLRDTLYTAVSSHQMDIIEKFVKTVEGRQECTC